MGDGFQPTNAKKGNWRKLLIFVLFFTFSPAHFDSVCGEEQSLVTSRV